MPPAACGGTVDDMGMSVTAWRAMAVRSIGEGAADGFPQHKDTDDCLDAILAARAFLASGGPASMREIVSEIMPDHALGYDVPNLEPDDRYRGAWWRKIVKPGLKAAPDVVYGDGQNVWLYDASPGFPPTQRQDSSPRDDRLGDAGGDGDR